MLFKLSGMNEAMPPPGVLRAELPCAQVLLKKTWSPATGAPVGCQFCASDQLVFRFGTSAPLQRTEDRWLLGPAVRTISSSLPFSCRLPWNDGFAVGSVPSVALMPLNPLVDVISGM